MTHNFFSAVVKTFSDILGSYRMPMDEISCCYC